ncbi:hypothetical protein CNMCM5793_006755 [Aspergillus hiratsukae]|uniref:Uncharacterized protein n=1 Tax=Aspergillus hiratsukae TaxID=1194566 RepID=A0A8H6PHN8_9EURO|nr:hypothetical protein CNMCM5793_006755 [Aspergillus hiratsukae]KAF7173657.1 hypothetical protein CNMCM6106_007702 [Aspergillus hiratsukae]
MLPIPDNLAYAIEETTWGKSVDTLDKENQTEEILNGHITCILRAWTTMRITDLALWNDFKDEFNGWTLDTFKVANKTVLKMLRPHLTTHGVSIRIGPGISFAKGLHDCLQEDTQHEWTEEDIQDHLKEHPDNFTSRWNPARDQSRTIQPNPLSVRATTADPPNPRASQTTMAKPPIEPSDPRWNEDRLSTFDKAYMDDHVQQQPGHGSM